MSARHAIVRNLQQLRFDRSELAGALGDLGTFLPLLVGMVSRCGLQVGPALFFAGLMNVVTGLAFGLPMPVQPMKAIATVAIAEGFDEAQILTAGMTTGLVVAVLALTGLVERLSGWLPKSVVRGLQLAIGLKLASGGVGMIAATHALFGWDSIGLGIVCAAVVLTLSSSRRLPAALVVFAIGLVALVASSPALLATVHWGMAWRLPALGDLGDWQRGFWLGAVPQIPLTLLNSVIAVCALSGDLFPQNPAPPKRVAISVGLMNLACCPLGAMPMCHGAGGLAAQHWFGGRTGGCVIVLGLTKMALAVALGGALLAWLGSFPQSVLGVMLLFGGVELALVCRDQRAPGAFAVMAMTAGACLATNTAAGLAIGWSIAMIARAWAPKAGRHRLSSGLHILQGDNCRCWASARESGSARDPANEQSFR